MAERWPAFQHFYDNEREHQRIIRALHFFNHAYHVWPANLSHITFHAALESMICTSPYNNRKQVTKRLPQLLKGMVTEDQATAIYDLCVDVKHNAAPSLLYSASTDKIDYRDSRRQDAAIWLEDSLRHLFTKALEDNSFAKELIDPKILESKYAI